MNSNTVPRSMLNRRGFLTAAALVGGAGAAGLMAGCSSGASSNPTVSAAAGAMVELPTYVPSAGLTPDLPGTPEGVQAGYFTYPKELVKSVATPPGTGTALSSMIMTFATPPSNSQYFEAVKTAMNAPIDLVLVPAGDYIQRFSTVMAGGDLPQTIEIPGYLALPRIADFLKSQCVDLSEHLSGDAVKKYPNLAAVPTQSWRSTRINGRLYGVPIPRNVFAPAPFYRKDIVDSRGVALPTNADEFVAFCEEFTSREKGVFALGATDDANPFGSDFYRGMFGVPSFWREKGGKLTHFVETDEFKESVAFSKRLWDAGVYHPDSPSMKTNQATDLFNGGKLLIAFKGNSGWAINQRTGQAVDPKLLVGVLPQIGADGGPGQTNLGGGAFGYTVITNTAKDRVEEILSILDYLAAPFGSEEYHLVNYGTEGLHHTAGPNGPVLTEKGKSEVIQSFQYMAAPEGVLFDAEFVEEFVKPAHAWQTELAPHMVANPVTGLISDTESRVSASLQTMINDTVTSVTVGRKPLSALDDLVAGWRAGGGTKMIAEYENALAES